MAKGIIKLTHDEIDKILEYSNNDRSKEIDWEFISEEEIEYLLNIHP